MAKRKSEPQEVVEPPKLVDFGEDLPGTVPDEVAVPEAASPVAPEVGETPAPTPVAQTHLSPFLVGMARQYGLKDDDLRDMSQKEVERFVEHAHRREQWHADNYRTYQQQAQPAPPATPAPVVEPEIDLGLDDSYPAEIKAALKKVATAKDAEIAELRDAVKELTGMTRSAKQKAQLRALEGAFEDLGNTYSEFLGKGNKLESLTSEQITLRELMIRQLSDDDSPEDIKQKLTNFSKLCFKAPPAAPAAGPTPLEIAKKDYAENTTAKPEQREATKKPHGPKRAEEALEAEMTKRGMIKVYNHRNGDSDDTVL